MKHVDLHIDNNVVDEWKAHYVDYKRLRKLCHALYPTVHEQVTSKTRSPFSVKQQFDKLQKKVAPRRPSFESMPIEDLVLTHRPVSEQRGSASASVHADGAPQPVPHGKSLDDSMLPTGGPIISLHSSFTPASTDAVTPRLHDLADSSAFATHPSSSSSSSSERHGSLPGNGGGGGAGGSSGLGALVPAPSEILKRLFAVLHVSQDDSGLGQPRHTCKELAQLEDNDKLALFIDELKFQIKKCNRFFLHVEKELTDSLAAVNSQAATLDIFAESSQMMSTVRDSLELLYRRWHMLFNFATLNNLALDALVDLFDDHAILSQQLTWQSHRFHTKVAQLARGGPVMTAAAAADPEGKTTPTPVTAGDEEDKRNALELVRTTTGNDGDGSGTEAMAFNIQIDAADATPVVAKSTGGEGAEAPTTPTASASPALTGGSQLTHRHKHSAGNGTHNAPLIPPHASSSSSSSSSSGSKAVLPPEAPSGDVAAALTSRLHASNAASQKMPKFPANCRYAFTELIRETSIRNTMGIPDVIKGIVKVYADKFTGGDHGKAKADLTTGMSDADLSLEVEYLKLGIKLGAVLVMIVWNILSFVNYDDSIVAAAYLPVFRGFGLLILLMWVWGAVIYVWSKYRVNWVFIFEVNPLDCLTYMQVWDEAATVSILYLIMTDLFFLRDQRGWAAVPFPPLIYPFVLLLFLLLKLFWPYRPFSHWQTRRVLLGSILNVAIAPFGRLLFRDMYVADVLTSITRVLTDFYYDFCFYFSGIWLTLTPTNLDASACNGGAQLVVVPIIIALPLFWRFNQCMRLYWNTRQAWPHCANAFKYFLGYLVVLLGGLHPKYSTADESWDGYRVVWLIFFVVSTLYSITWDLYMDWGLFREGWNSPTPFLRKQLMYPHYYYYVGMVLNTLMRFLWTINLVPFSLSIIGGQPSSYYRAVIAPIFMCLEVVRRGIWSVFRVECAHVGHWDEFKKLDFVPVPLNVKPVVVVKQEWKKIFFEFSTMLILVVVTAALVTNT